MRITDDELWDKILNNEINGYSYEATVNFLPAILAEADDGTRTGYTEPDPFDGHRHAFMVLVDADNRPLSGGTDEVDHGVVLGKTLFKDVNDGCGKAADGGVGHGLSQVFCAVPPQGRLTDG